MARQALIVWGGWEGHTPQQCAELIAGYLADRGLPVELSNSLDVFTDRDRMSEVGLIVPIWSMGEITPEQEQGMLAAVKAGAGLAGFHGGMCDAFRNNPNYQWMTGGQWVAHPGDILPSYQVEISDRAHPITMGLEDFKLVNTEQYYLHVDPSNHVLATTTFADGPVTMPYAWTRNWGEGRVFYAAWGHTFRDFDIPEAREILFRGMLWASN